MYTHPNSNIEHSVHGMLTAELARAAATPGSPEHTDLFPRLSAKMCWDAMLMCAAEANGIKCSQPVGIITAQQYDKVFDPGNSVTVADEVQLRSIPRGSFLGFVDRHNKWLIHAMIYLGDGEAAGTKNSNVLSRGKVIGWEILDLKDYFTKDRGLNAGRYMLATPVDGQKI
jgi:hypothetical protein